MPTTLRIELAKAGFTVGTVGTQVVVQDYADTAKSGRHAEPSAARTITSTDPILDQKFSNGFEWLGHRDVVAYDANFLYAIVNLPTQGAGFKKFPLSPGQITTKLPTVSENRFNYNRIPL